MKPNVLLLTGSMNQTSQMHQISQHLPDCNCYFSQLYADSAVINYVVRRGWLDYTILAGNFRKNSEAYLRQHNLRMDYRGEARHYDLVVLCSDLLVPANIRATRSVWVQEGMIDPVTTLTRLIKALRLPRYLSVGTSLNGASNLCDVYCTASEGYSDFFARMGTDRQKLFVTGLPNYDNLETYRQNEFPHQGYVIVATSDIRETFRVDNRPAFIRQCVAKANGRQLLFKLHPNEIYERAVAEIQQYAPADTLIFREGDTNAMIANCSELITQYSSVVYVGIVLGKPVHSYFDLESLYRQTPVQNGGASAENIARLCQNFLDFTGSPRHFARWYREANAIDTKSFEKPAASMSASRVAGAIAMIKR